MPFLGPFPLDMWAEIAGWAPDARTWASVRATHPLMAARLDPEKAKKRYALLVDVRTTEDPFCDLFDEFCLPFAWLLGFPPDSRARFWRLPNGALHGRCELITCGGFVYAEGAFVDGAPHGLWVERQRSYDKERGTFERGIRSGRWCWWDEEGRVLTMGDYLNGQRDGHWCANDFKTSATTQGAYANGKKQGPWVKTDLQGHLLAVREYRDGKEHGREMSFHCGRIESSTHSVWPQGDESPRASHLDHGIWRGDVMVDMISRKLREKMKCVRKGNTYIKRRIWNGKDVRYLPNA